MSCLALDVVDVDFGKRVSSCSEFYQIWVRTELGTDCDFSLFAIASPLLKSLGNTNTRTIRMVSVCQFDCPVLVVCYHAVNLVTQSPIAMV